MKFDLFKITSNRADIFFTNIETKPTVGLLFPEAARRARYRACGVVRQEGDPGFIEIQENGILRVLDYHGDIMLIE